MHRSITLPAPVLCSVSRLQSRLPVSYTHLDVYKRQGYSSTENTNNIAEPHLHFGLQLIFDESQKEGNNEIWIDCYELIRFLAINRSETVKKDGTKEWTRVYEMKDSSLEQFSTQ